MKQQMGSFKKGGFMGLGFQKRGQEGCSSGFPKERNVSCVKGMSSCPKSFLSQSDRRLNKQSEKQNQAMIYKHNFS